MEQAKPFHTIILDTGPIIKNDPPISTLLAKSQQLLTLPSILLEIRDAPTRARVETTLKPFLQLRDPKPESVKIIQDFARRTGDLQVLSRVDVAVLALAYEVECERNGGDWRLRRVPGQKGLNGSPPGKKVEEEGVEKDEVAKEGEEAVKEREAKEGSEAVETKDLAGNGEGRTHREPMTDEATIISKQGSIGKEDNDAVEANVESKAEEPAQDRSLDDQLASTRINEESTDHNITPQAPESLPTKSSQPEVLTSQSSSSEVPPAQPSQSETPSAQPTDPDLESDSDSEGWITPSNLSKHQAADASPAPSTTTKSTAPTTLQVATLTSDFAMQNVLLLMNLNLISPSLTRISQLKTHILRCHACFLQVKDLSKQFCPRCGQPALTRVTCSTDMRTGEFKLHLKKNMQWNTRGDRYSIPKPVHGSANGKRDVGGGKGGWGNELILSEDQKEYVKKMGEAKREKARDLMDEDYLPSLLTGERARMGGRVKVGAGRTINSRKR